MIKPVEYKRVIVYGSIMSIDDLNMYGDEGWILCAAVVLGNGYNYLFCREIETYKEA